jgi:hypothetical protein
MWVVGCARSFVGRGGHFEPQTRKPHRTKPKLPELSNYSYFEVRVRPDNFIIWSSGLGLIPVVGNPNFLI